MSGSIAFRSDSFPGPISEARIASTAAGGTALTTSAALIPFPNGTTHVQVLPRNFSTAIVVKLAINPYLAVLLNNDRMVTVPVDYSDAAQDGVAATQVTLSALAASPVGAVYVGSPVPFRGLRSVTVDANTGAASTLAADYWNGSAWVTTTPTDGTTAGGKTFAQSGDITWTVPTAWAKKDLETILGTANAYGPFGTPAGTLQLYWIRLTVSAALSATVTLSSLLALNRSTVYAELPETMGQEFRVSKKLGGHAGLEALTDAGTANLIVNVFTQLGGAFA